LVTKVTDISHKQKRIASIDMIETILFFRIQVDYQGFLPLFYIVRTPCTHTVKPKDQSCRTSTRKQNGIFS